jgi:hypothetical protein
MGESELREQMRKVDCSTIAAAERRSLEWAMVCRVEFLVNCHARLRPGASGMLLQVIVMEDTNSRLVELQAEKKLIMI